MRDAWTVLGWCSIAMFATVAGCAGGGGSSPPRGDGGVDAGRGCMTDDDCPDDGIFCNGGLACMGGRCVAQGIPTCNDGIGCTRDDCLTATDACQNTPIDSSCPMGTVCVPLAGCMVAPACEFDGDCRGDGVYCNGDEVCIDAMCTSPGTRECNDSNNCTIDECVETTMACTSTPGDHLTDPARCGPTGMNDCVVCPAPPAGALHMLAGCEAGACVLVCESGWGDADSNPANGCECASTGSDIPEMTFTDSNCDGIDGDVAIGVFVAPLAVGGNDANPGTKELPVATIGRGVEIANTAGRARKEVYVAAGSYAESVVLPSGVSIYGGYNAARSWLRSGTFVSEIRGGASAVTVTGTTADLEIQLFTIVSAGATMPGASSYGIRISNSTGLVTCTSNRITTGNGAAGTDGMDGTAGSDGGRGRNGHNGCNGCSGYPCGAAPCNDGGASACAAGGRGGNGGYNTGGGENGTTGATGSTTGTGGPGGTGGGAAAICFDSSQAGGTPTVGGGNGSDGVHGPAVVAALGTVSGGLYVPRNGNAGTAGSHGGGGGSFGIFATTARLVANDNVIGTGDGGVGGRGGAGGAGGAPGAGGGGGAGADDARGGGNGGSGGRGGHAGAGSGGPGGPSYGIFTVSTATSSSGNAITPGTEGAGGAGGTSAIGTAAAGPAGDAGTTYSM